MTAAFTSKQVAAMDRYVTEILGVDLKQLMEVAGLRSAEAARRLFPERKRLTVLAGPGGNGGDALVCAKWLLLWGFGPTIILSSPREKLKAVTKDQLRIWENYGGKIAEDPPKDAEGIIDGLLGYSLEGPPKGRAAELIRWANASGLPVLALDIPSGLDATTGEALEPCIRALHTVTYGVMKRGLLAEGAQAYTGRVELVDIGFPREWPEEVLGEA